MRRARAREVNIKITAAATVILLRKGGRSGAPENRLAGASKGSTHAGAFPLLQQHNHDQRDANNHVE